MPPLPTLLGQHRYWLLAIRRSRSYVSRVVTSVERICSAPFGRPKFFLTNPDPKQKCHPDRSGGTCCSHPPHRRRNRPAPQRYPIGYRCLISRRASHAYVVANTRPHVAITRRFPLVRCMQLVVRPSKLKANRLRV